MARNHTDKGVRVSWKIVPAVTEVWYPHPAHSLRLRTGHAFPDPQWAQRKPVGQRSRAKYARHASSVLKFASTSVRLRGYSSTISAHYILGLPGYPPRRIFVAWQEKGSGGSGLPNASLETCPVFRTIQRKFAHASAREKKYSQSDDLHRRERSPDKPAAI